MADSISNIEAAENLEEVYDTSDPKAVNKARKKASRTRADRLRFVAAGMEHEEGRSWFYDHLNRCHIFNRSFDPDPYVHAYKAGEVNVGLQLLLDIQDAAPDKYLVMITENRNK
jgi:GrpB-like predicted nucleotidyltransferase (UPF0157 family)